LYLPDQPVLSATGKARLLEIPVSWHNLTSLVGSVCRIVLRFLPNPPTENYENHIRIYLAFIVTDGSLRRGK
jgi:hypothetical protein